MIRGRAHGVVGAAEAVAGAGGVGRVRRPLRRDRIPADRDPGPIAAGLLALVEPVVAHVGVRREEARLREAEGDPALGSLGRGWRCGQSQEGQEHCRDRGRAHPQDLAAPEDRGQGVSAGFWSAPGA